VPADVTAYPSRAEDLVLHAPRVLGFASARRIASRFRLDADEVEDLLLGFGAKGWVGHARFADSAGWSLTGSGRLEDERRMAAELDESGARGEVAAAHAAFVPLNRRFARTCTDWQIRPTRTDAMAGNDHTDWTWDDRVFRSLEALGRDLARVMEAPVARLARFDGYAARYSAARAKVDGGQRRWVDSPEVESCHTVWIQLHEDLLSTLGVARGSDD
jgi:hypothetical protein